MLSLPFLPFFSKSHNRRTQIVVDYLVRLYAGIALILLTLAIGVLGYMIIEHYNFIDAFYMTIITLATVGFMEVQPLSEAGRVFTSLLIITNIGIFTYAITVLSSFLVEGNFRKLWEHYVMLKKAEHLTNHVIVCGYGRYGREVCNYFAHHNIPFLVIEAKPDVVEELKSQNIIFVEEDATHDEALEEAGIHRARALVTTLPEDADNVYVVLTARQMAPNLHIISRAAMLRSEAKLHLAGANEVIMPEKIGGFYMAALTTKPDVVEFFKILSNETQVGISIEELIFDDIAPKPNAPRTIRDLDIRANTGANLIGIKTPDGRYLINPSPDTIIEARMCLIALGTPQQIDELKAYCQQQYKNNHPKTKLKF
ncbi:MAG: potassium channel protein [Sphingobacteriales bacterium]|nr:potassium channel protein [Sphingobacteriales bacterium]MBP6664826.1 potassium channel protein [Chitinophagales bacterium]